MNRNHSLLLGIFWAAVSLLGSLTHAVADETRWEPKRTRVFLVSLSEFKGGVVAPWGNQERLDRPLVNLLENRGVPESQIVFLTDAQASSQNLKKELNDFLDKSSAGEFLIFYFGSHGEYNPKTCSYSYVSYDGQLPFEWAFDSIESHFKGSHVMMFGDCCYSGGIVDLAVKRRSPIAYACLSSTYAHNLGFSGWRFLDCMTRGFAGSPVVDLNGDGKIDFSELAQFTEKHMAFVAETKPMFVTTKGFDPKLILSEASGTKRDPQIGKYVEALYKGKWHKSEITDVKPGQVKVHHTAQGATYNDWVALNQTRPFTYPHFQKGARVEAKGASDGKWYPATVLDSWENLHFCRYDGYSSAYDEWIEPERLKGGTAPDWNGNWVGIWENSTGQKGKDSLELTQDAEGNLSGTWSGDVKVSGKPIDEGNARLVGRNAMRSYEFTATRENGTVHLKYVATRLDSGGSYEGKSTLTPAK